MIYYFSGTGNSRYAAITLSEQLCVEAIDIRQWLPRMCFSDLPQDNDDIVGLVFPVYGWTIPPILNDFLKQWTSASRNRKAYYFAVLTCGDEVGTTHTQLRHLLNEKGVPLHAVWSLQMPNTYVALPFFDVDSTAVVKFKKERADHQLLLISESIHNRQENITMVVTGSFPSVRSGLLRWIFFRWFVSPSLFRGEGHCTACQRCVKACPTQNILVTSADKGPVWNEHCAFCLACYHICPEKNILVHPFGKQKGQSQWFSNYKTR